MRRRKQNILLDVLLGAGADLLYSMRHRLGNIEDLRDRASESYEAASRRIGRASDALRGQDRRALSTVTTLLMGVGAGVGIGMLVAPAGISETAKKRFETTSRRIGGATDALRGRDHDFLSTATALLLGMGAGVGIGILVAPASGQKTRADISEKAKDFGEKIRSRSSSEAKAASGTYGE
jgi:hypothetical protein